jgi:hypothetical protein
MIFRNRQHQIVLFRGRGILENLIQNLRIFSRDDARQVSLQLSIGFGDLKDTRGRWRHFSIGIEESFQLTSTFAKMNGFFLSVEADIAAKTSSPSLSSESGWRTVARGMGASTAALAAAINSSSSASYDRLLALVDAI